MDDKKKAARFEMLKALSKKKSSEMNEPKKGALTEKFKKFQPSEEKEEPAKKKLTKGQEILKAKLGKLFDDESEDELEEESDEESHECEYCSDDGCAECEEDEDADE